MATDPTSFSVWFAGRPFPVSAYPFGPQAGGGKHWSVQTTDGQWHLVDERNMNVSSSAEQKRVEVVVVKWLMRLYPDGIAPQAR